MAKRKGIIARAVDGRLDRSILGDVAVLIGLGVMIAGLWQLHRPSAWLFAGAVIAGGAVMTLLPPKKASGSPRGEA